MYLSKVALKPGRLDNAWEWHRKLWTLFPDVERRKNEPSPFLFRIDKMNPAEGAIVLMQSNIEPHDSSDKATVLARKSFTPQVNPEQQLRFILSANVTKTIRDKDNPERKIRVPLIKEGQQLAWLQRKIDDIAEIDTDLAKVRDHPPLYFFKNRQAGKIVVTTFEGVIQVWRPDEFQGLLSKGIGAAKAFGCGLMLIRRI